MPTNIQYQITASFNSTVTGIDENRWRSVSGARRIHFLSSYAEFLGNWEVMFYLLQLPVFLVTFLTCFSVFSTFLFTFSIPSVMSSIRTTRKWKYEYYFNVKWSWWYRKNLQSVLFSFGKSWFFYLARFFQFLVPNIHQDFLNKSAIARTILYYFCKTFNFLPHSLVYLSRKYLLKYW